MDKLSKQNDKFNIIIFLTLLSLFFATVFFIYLNTFVTTHPTGFEVTGDINNADFTSQQAKIYFSRPMQKVNIKQLVDITPNINFNTVWSGNVLFIIFTESLNTNTTYQIKIDKSIKDSYGSSMASNITYEFKTKLPQLAYIEKTYGKTEDKIVLTDVNLKNRKTLFEAHKTIKYFGLNKKFLVSIIKNNDNSDDISIVNLIDNVNKTLDLTNTVISGFDFSPTANEFVFISQEVELKDKYYLPKSNNTISIYNLDTNESTHFDPKNTAKDVIDVKYSRDGNFLLYKSSDSFFNLAEINNQDNFVSIGRYMASGNFNRNNTNILFINYDPLQTYSKSQFLVNFDADRNVNMLTDGEIPVLDPQYMNKQDKIIYAEKYMDLERTKGIYKIMSIDLNKNKIEVLSDKERSLELPKISPDDKYIAIERYNTLDLLNYKDTRNFGFQDKPAYSNLIVYDIDNKNIIDEGIIGVSAYWMR